ncbi:EutP/PduV family microcompartment system protein [Entomohabitans teleogrylli]|uniref:EutP/PduV family microcompartment system protein n=1 Tax=Entomohabitans teleogrylli TaxID=1384589 RepID=UPI00073DB23F|nr:EutP/PduV family microcompartment system protein [Entomohabitans teleogrylli]
MKRIMFIGPSQCGKTTLTQALHGETLHYQKTQAIEWRQQTIDTPGEYLENRCLYSALLASACEADLIGLVLNANAEWSQFAPGFAMALNRPAIGIVSKADLATPERVQWAAQCLREAGAESVFITSAPNGAGISQLLTFLETH